MKEPHKISGIVKRMFPNNPISYLGWFGVIGILGVFFSPSLVPFLICFSFFGYRNMLADELFWENVHRSGARAFWVAFILNSTVLFGLFIRGMTADMEYVPVEFVSGEDKIIMSTFIFNTYSIAFFTFIGGLVLMLLVFSISMMRFRHREKQALKGQEETEL